VVGGLTQGRALGLPAGIVQLVSDLSGGPTGQIVGTIPKSAGGKFLDATVFARAISLQ